MYSRCAAILFFQGPKRSHLNANRVYPGSCWWEPGLLQCLSKTGVVNCWPISGWIFATTSTGNGTQGCVVDCAAILLFQVPKRSYLNGNRVYPLAHVGGNLASSSASPRHVVNCWPISGWIFATASTRNGTRGCVVDVQPFSCFKELERAI